MSTGYLFDEIFTKHNLPGHPENANRLSAIMDYLAEHDILPHLLPIPARPATQQELERCHVAKYIELVKMVSQKGGGMLDADTYTNQFSYEAAVKACGGMVDLTTAVLDGRLDNGNGFAIVRPPGHHAVSERAMGFCLFGTVAVAAKSALVNGALERVAIVDFDVHHGNGTQDIVADDPNILFISSHQYPFYPGTGSLYEVGTGRAKGTVVNLPLETHTGDEGIKQLYGEIVFPLLRRFQPELILVSAGFDAHWDDPLANICLSLSGYHWLCQNLVDIASELCGGKIVFTLEGGYNLNVLAPGVGNLFRVLTSNSTVEDELGLSPYPEVDVSELTAQLKQIHNI